MLVLTRRLGESIVVGDDIITVLNIQKHQVYLDVNISESVTINLKKLKQIGLDTDRDLSDLVSEAIEDLATKYTSKTTSLPYFFFPLVSYKIRGLGLKMRFIFTEELIYRIGFC